ncbi:hypothetical protein SD70_30285 [Gordoniibacillus kamchatkensis]|uniref:Uncharacterized protein n=1 Tax=Gordoniibacillus kamchatkensis TaxID=1590651 RepID=A0ABR5AA23_9BACL|nr:PspA/IM30 family protein [Paenibacillus sp. VKM B-2647]KIL37858.1 hypothetical protein SD70_30285 [Paenibacillus sp. VKM B-2647]
MTLLTRAMDRTKAPQEPWKESVGDPHDAISAELATLENEMEHVERTAAAMIGTERELLGQLEEAAFLSGELGLRAIQATEEGRDYVAKQMLEEKGHYDAIVAEVRHRYQEARARVQELVEKLYGLKEQAFELRKKLGPPLN